MFSSSERLAFQTAGAARETRRSIMRVHPSGLSLRRMALSAAATAEAITAKSQACTEGASLALRIAVGNSNATCPIPLHPDVENIVR